MDVSFPPLTDTNNKDYATVIYAEIGGHDVHRIPGIHSLRAVPSTTHGMMKFPTRVEVATIMSERARPLEKPDVASASRSSPKNRKCQGYNTLGIPKAIRHYWRKSN
ncbi:hypothetical protein Tco_1544410 [Tanacetum coccineum]